MAEIAGPKPCTPAAWPVAIGRIGMGKDAQWLVVMTVVTGVELLWWAAAWRFGIAPAARTGTYLGLAFAALAVAIALRLALRLKPSSARWADVVTGTALVGVGASAFLPLKYAI